MSCVVREAHLISFSHALAPDAPVGRLPTAACSQVNWKTPGCRVQRRSFASQSLGVMCRSNCEPEALIYDLRWPAVCAGLHRT